MKLKLLNIAIRGHVRDSFDDDQLYQFVKKLTTNYTCKLFFHTWNIKRSDLSWRSMNKDASEITEDIIHAYFRDICIEKILIDDDQHIKLHGSTTGFIGGYTCKKLAWKNYWYGQKRVMELIGDKDPVLNMRFDMFTGPFNPPVRVEKCLTFVEQNMSLDLYEINFIHGDQYLWGLDNMYMGPAKSIQNLATHFHLNLDQILKEDNFKTRHQEFLVLTESRKLGLSGLDNINVFLLCYNESPLIPHMVRHYKKYLPSCKITIYDNESTDNSVQLAKSLGCNIVSWNSNNIIDDYKYIDIKNNCWKNVKSGWIIVGDMDEFLCVTEKELLAEKALGATMLSIKGIDMIGQSVTLDLSDIDLQSLTKFVDNDGESKNLCFLREKIQDMNYVEGAHKCRPIGLVQYSSKEYINKHMCMLGLPFLTQKMIKRYERSSLMRTMQMAIHYTDDVEKIKKDYFMNLARCNILREN